MEREYETDFVDEGLDEEEEEDGVIDPTALLDFDVDEVLDEELRNMGVVIPDPGDAIHRVIGLNVEDIRNLDPQTLLEFMWIVSQYIIRLRALQSRAYSRERIHEEKVKTLIDAYAAEMPGRTQGERRAKAKLLLAEEIKQLEKLKGVRRDLYKLDETYQELLQVLKRHYDWLVMEWKMNKWTGG